MAFTVKQLAVVVGFLGTVSFVFGVLAELKKPPAGEPIQGKDVVICKYPSDPSVAYGYLSAVFLIASTAVGYYSLFYPYEGKSVPQSEFFSSKKFAVFFNVALGTAGLGAALILYTTISEHHILTHNVHRDLDNECATAKTGLLGGGAFASLDASMFWLIVLMLGTNVREDYFDDQPEKGDYSEAAVTIG